LTTGRLSASIATWSQVSPLRSSAGSSGSQSFSLLATKDHFSSDRTSRVRGGKLDRLVVRVASVLAGGPAQAADGAPVHLAEPAGLAGASPLVDVRQGRLDLPRRQSRVEQGRPPPLGGAGLAGPTAEHAAGLLRAGAASHRQVFRGPLCIVGGGGNYGAQGR